MLSLIYLLTEQIIRPGRTAQIVLMIVVGILCYLSYYMGKQGKTWGIRPLEGLEAIYEGIGRAAEMGRPVLILPGISDLGSPQTLAGLTVLGEVAQRGASIGVPTITVASSSTVITASEAIMRGAYRAAGKPELYAPGKYVRWFGADQFSFAVGTAGLMLAEKPAMIVYIGYFLYDMIVSGETGSRIGAMQIGGTIGNLELIAQFCDYILVGEEIYAAAASITGDNMVISTIAGQDWIKLIVVSITVLGVILMVLGSKYILNILGV
jgi:hypothetical protein